MSSLLVQVLLVQQLPQSWEKMVYACFCSIVKIFLGQKSVGAVCLR
tara:strand:+ start:520 stop:657 length:138 start_codon:yes stop_codon:yes gene_type:complete